MYKNNKKIVFTMNRVALHLLLICLALISIIPFIIMITNATRSSSEIIRGVSFLPGSSFLENMKLANSSVNLFKGFLNSSYISISITIASIYIACLVAYGFYGYNFKGKKVLFSIVFFAMMFPAQLSIIGFYQMITSYNLLDNHLAIILPSLANPAAIFFIRQYAIQVIPKSLIESSRIDGATEFYIFNRIILPLLKPASITMGIFAFITSWNKYLTPMLILKSKEKYTLPIMIRIVESAEQYTINYGAVYFAIAITVMPILIIFITFSKRIISGLVAGAVKG